jgi:serine phosphatase RsbU (regulator of sigma subunit)
MGELDMKNQSLRLSNGGCPYLYHYQSSTREIVELRVDAYPLGVSADSEYSIVETSFQSGDCLIFCSDGVIEVANEQDEMLGYDRVAALVQQTCREDLSAGEILDRILDAAQTFRGETSQADDMTCVVIRIE